MIKRPLSFDDIPLVLTVEELMPILSVGRNTAFSLVRSGQIRSIRTGKQIRILKHDLHQFLEGGTGTETTWTDIGYPEARVLLPCCNPSIFVLKWGK